MNEPNEPLNNKKNKVSVWGLMGLFLAVAVISVFPRQGASDQLSGALAQWIPDNSIVWNIIFIIGLAALVYQFWNAIKKRPDHKYPRILEEGSAGEEFTGLSDEKKRAALERVKKIVIIGLILSVIFLYILVNYIIPAA